MGWIEEANPADLLSTGFLLFLILLVFLYRGRLKAWKRLSATYLVLMGLQSIVTLGRAEGLTPPLIGAFFPVVPIVVVFFTLGFISELNPHDQDALLSRLDRALLRTDPNRWLDRLTRPWLTEVMQMAYLVYYVLPFVLLGTLYQRGDEGAFNLCVTALILSHYLAFIGYMMVPALGPRFAPASPDRPEFKGLLLAVPLRNLLNVLEGIKRDAFPSGHTSAILITVFYILRFTPEQSTWGFAAAGLMIISTVYLRYHYVVDVLAGGLLAGLCLVLAPFFQ